MTQPAVQPPRPAATAARPDAAIRTDDLRKTYTTSRGDVPAVQGISLDVAAGQFFGLLGPNGDGKSTTIGMLTTLIVPTGGRAWVSGIDVVANPVGVKRTIEDRALAPVPLGVLAFQKIAAGAVQAFFGALIVVPIVLYVHAAGQTPHAHVTNWFLLALVLVAASMLTAALGLLRNGRRSARATAPDRRRNTAAVEIVVTLSRRLVRCGDAGRVSGGPPPTSPAKGWQVSRMRRPRIPENRA